MNIAILTLPLHTNYGGILQAYALQKIPWIVDRFCIYRFCLSISNN